MHRPAVERLPPLPGVADFNRNAEINRNQWPTSFRNWWPTSSGIRINSEPNWDFVQKAAKAARWLGYVPFDRIRDERNAEPEILRPEHPISTGFGQLYASCLLDVPGLEAVLPYVSASAPEPLQPYRIIFVGEKSSLRDKLRPLAQEIGAELVLPTGEASDTIIAGIASRAAADGRPAVVLYFSDFDPSGLQMPVSVARKLQALRDLEHPDLQIEVHRVALILDQVTEFGLPSTPLKETERRADKWQAIWGREQTEIDALIALHPGAVHDLAEQAIAPFYDPTLQQRARRPAAEWEAKARQELLSSENYPAACSVIENALEGVSAAVNALKQAQANALAILPRLHTRIPAPDPVIEAVPPDPLFTSRDAFCTASLRLIAAKRLEGE